MGGGRIPALTAARQRLDFTGLSGFPPYGGDYSIIATCRSTGVCGVWGFAFQCAACFAFLLMFCAGVCGLPMCGHGRGNGARPREMADSRVLATARHIHICLRVAVLRDSSHFRGFRPASGGEASRAVHPRELGQGDACSSLASGKSSTPPARCIHHSRHDASSAGYRLLASFAPGVASREPESRRSPALAPRTRRLAPTFRCGAFFFVASELADVPSACLTLTAAKPPRSRNPLTGRAPR